MPNHTHNRLRLAGHMAASALAAYPGVRPGDVAEKVRIEWQAGGGEVFAAPLIERVSGDTWLTVIALLSFADAVLVDWGVVSGPPVTIGSQTTTIEREATP